MKKTLLALALAAAFLTTAVAGFLAAVPEAEAVPVCYDICEVHPDGTMTCIECNWSPVLHRCVCSAVGL